ncbi:RNA-dependent ATPase [Naganishia onofrii]|uniref:RNA-dependent ATPase n=1 Tax=Naganishia onofrii TaxID=1851511 RepID=A0ACC2XQY1_9TREE|nr:RNA-dependent ATPase [Naganishia onofrii]
MSQEDTQVAPPAVVVDKKEKKDKKKKDKKKRTIEDVNAAEDASAVTAADEGEKKKKKKKSKNGEAEVTNGAEAAAAVAVEEPKEKKEKKEKKDKKEKKSKKDVTEDSTAVASTSSTSSAPSLDDACASQAESDAFLATHNITLKPSTYRLFLDFAKLPINPAFRPYLKDYKQPTPIQAASWPKLFAGDDVVGIAETGSGKTLTFGLPGLQLLTTLPSSINAVKGKGNTNPIQILVLAPTRELALQTYDTVSALGKFVGIGAVCLYGGMSRDEQVREVRKKDVRVVVGTPGRILDLANSGDVDFSNVKYLVLDEADRMLDQGFENDIRQIIAFCPKKNEGRQTLMFSATWPESVRRLASTFLTKPMHVTVGSDELTANKRITQGECKSLDEKFDWTDAHLCGISMIVVEVFENPREKEGRLLAHLRDFFKSFPKNSPVPARILVFALYKKEATRLEQTIKRAGYSVAGLHGDLGQEARIRALNSLKDGNVNVLVATDVAARGLDIPSVQLVINVTFPLTTEDYVHRIGRTGRAGLSGKAITFYTGEGHEKALAGEFKRVLRDAGAEIPEALAQMSGTIKKKEHGSYGAFYKDTSDAPAPKKIKFD